MKLTKSKLKQIIKEEMRNLERPMPEFSPYETEDMSTDTQMVLLLKEILSQLKVLNYHMTPAKRASTSGLEQAMAQAQVAENKQ
jgi:hypothetical protein